MTSSYRAIEVLLAEQTPLPPPACATASASHRPDSPGPSALTPPHSTHGKKVSEPEAPLRAAYAYFLARAHTLGTYYAQAIAEPHPTAPAEATDTAQVTLALLSPCHPPCSPGEPQRRQEPAAQPFLNPRSPAPR